MAVLLPVVPWLLAAIALVRLGRRRPYLEASPPATSPRVSVIVPARNESGSIETVIRSVLPSPYPDLEFIVVDDRSSDDTAERGARLAQSDPRRRLREAPASIRGCRKPGQSSPTTATAFSPKALSRPRPAPAAASA